MEDYKDYTDEQLIALVRQGDFKAQDFLLEKYKNLVRSKIRTYFLNGAADEDTVQEGMIGLFKAIRDYSEDKQASFKSFAELCVTRQIITAVKKATRQKHIPLNNYISLNKAVYDENSEKSLMDVLLVTDKDDPEAMIINQEDKKTAFEIIEDDLSRFEKTVLKMYLEGLTYSEIGQKLNKQPKSIDNALQRVKKKLDGRLNKIH